MANSNLSQTDNLKYTTDFQIEAIGIISGSGTFNVTDLMVELSYFENLFSPCLSGKLVLTDAAGLINLISFNGNEYIKINFRKNNRQSDNTQSETINKTFRIVTISQRTINTGNNYETYVIDFCSDEMILSEQYRISKSYKKTRISDIMIDIMNNYLKVGVRNNTKNFLYEKTDGVFDIVLPNKKIFDTINWLSKYAKSAGNKNGADMLFFETNLGFQFNSLQTLFSRPSVQTFTYNPKNISDEKGSPLLDEEQTEILKLEIMNNFDTLKGAKNGTFHNRLVTLNPLTRTMQKTDFSYDKYFSSSSENLNGEPVINNMKNRLGKTLYDNPPENLDSGHLRIFVSNSGYDNVDYIKEKPGSVSNNLFSENYIPNRVAQLQLAEYNKIKIVVPGYNEVYAGMVVTVEVVTTTAVSSKSGDRPLDPYLSGKYLVSGLRHLLTNTSYITVLELIKDTSISIHVPVNNKDPEYRMIVNGDQS